MSEQNSNGLNGSKYNTASKASENEQERVAQEKEKQIISERRWKAIGKCLKPDEGVALIGACVAAYWAPKELTGLWWAVSSVATGVAAGYGSRWGGVGGYIILGEMGAFAGVVLGGWMAYDVVKTDVDAWAINKQKPKVKIEEKIKQIPSVSLMLSKHDRAPERAALIQKKIDRSLEL